VAAVAFLGAVAVLVWAPLLATGRRRYAAPLAAAAGTALMLVLPSVILSADVPASLEAGIATAGFLLLVAGTAAVVAAATGRPAAGVAGAGLLGALLVAGFHLGDPLIEWSGPGRGSSLALGLLHAANPLSGAVGHALDVDWLRLPIMYSGMPGTTTGGLSSAQYYYGHYFPWWGTVLLHGGIGLALLAGVWRWERRVRTSHQDVHERDRR